MALCKIPFSYSRNAMPWVALLFSAACSGPLQVSSHGAGAKKIPSATYRLVTGPELRDLITGSVLTGISDKKDEIQLTSPSLREYYFEFGKFVGRGHQGGYSEGTYTLEVDAVCVKAVIKYSCMKIYEEEGLFFRVFDNSQRRELISISRIGPGEL